MNKPTFIIIGTGKAGTTSLYHYLNAHPEVFMSPVKETRFFAHEGGGKEVTGLMAKKPRFTTWEQYLSLFKSVQQEKAIGEVTPLYLYKSGVAERINDYLPEVKLVAILRQPSERAYSHYQMQLSRGKETAASFEEALKLEAQRIDQGWNEAFHYQNWGFYYRQLSRYYQIFKKEQIKLFWYHELKNDPARLVQDLYTFIGVDPTFRPNLGLVYNKTGTRQLPLGWVGERLKPFIKGKLSPRVLTVIQKLKNKTRHYPPLSPITKKYLDDAYRVDIQQLEKLARKDLSSWFKLTPVGINKN